MDFERLGSGLRWAATGLMLVIAAQLGCDAEELPAVEGSDLRVQELDARCEYLVRCGFMPDADTCQQSSSPDASLVQAVGSTSFARAAYDEEAAAVWLDTLRNLGCEATVANVRTLADARAAVFGGRISVGGSCFADAECEGDAVCDRAACPGNQVCCTGSCVETRVLTVGETCPVSQPGLRLTARCEDSAYCQVPEVEDGMEPPTEGTCAARVDNGLPCDTLNGCLDGQRCNVGASGNCYRLAGSGEDCNPDLQRGSCLDVNEVCSVNSSTCVAAPGPGEACVLGQCIGYATCIDDQCVALLTAGADCENQPSFCLGDLLCIDGRCQTESTVLVCVAGDPPPEPDPEG
ncbi:MAG: hypothetical protein K0V04_37615 [Deltaproteobacteria bacterium]|nr:hypothetical protein [Deltaproteobacteria bacterium]